MLSGFVFSDVRGMFGRCDRGEGTREMWAWWHWFHDGVVGGVADWGLDEQVDDGEYGREVDIGASFVDS